MKNYVKFLSFTLFLYFTISAFSYFGGNDEITADRVIAHIKYLASDELAGRFPGTVGDSLAEEYAIKEFVSSNLIPAGDDGYRERFNFISEVRLGDNNNFSLTLNNKKTDYKIEKDYKPLGYSSAGSIEGSLVFAGYGIKASDLNYNDFEGIDLKDKIAVILNYSPGYNNPHDNKFSSYESARRKCNMVKEAGAKGVIIVTGPESGDDELIPLRTSNDKLGIPSISVKRTIIEKIFAAGGKNLDAVQKKIDSMKVPNSFIINKASVNIQTDLQYITAYTSNILGYIEGNDPMLKNEVIVIGAHLDHLGDGMKYGSLYEKHEPAIHNGADDNASGDAGVMELAKKMSSVKGQWKRSYLFMLFNGEEAGLLGSAYFTKSELFKKYNIVSMINMDMIGRLTDNKLIVGGTSTSSIWNNILDSLNNISGFNLTKNPEGYGPSDHSSFYAKDIPVLFFFTGLHKDYHRPTDHWELINSDGEVKVLNMVYAVLNTLDNIQSKPDFIKAKDEKQQQETRGFRVTLGIIPDYSSTAEGLQILGVKAGGAGEKAGLVAGDIITKFGDYEIKNIYDYTSALGNYKPGDQTELVVKRGTDELKMKVLFEKK
jgi:aminopeptidase YwaD